MKKLCLFLLLMVTYVTTIFSQTISVANFKLLETDMTANTVGTLEKDQNGETAALIKVVTTQTGFSFDCGSMGIVKTLQKPSEIWVYVPRGVKKMTVSHPQLGLLRDYYFPVSIDAARTYEMVLTTGTVQTIVKQTSNSQYLVLKVSPANAVVELDNEILPTSDGIAQKFVKLGTYEYRVQAPDYHIAAGKVEVSDPNNKKIVEINLAPAFGWIEIPSNQEYDGAQVFIDNALVGTIPMKSKNLSSGEHNIKIVKPLYNPYSQTVVVKDNETTMVTPTLSANFSEVTINVDNDAEIYVNDEKKSIGTWTGRLASGNYLIEAKKENHRNTTQNVEISSSQSKTQIHLPSPTPIYGEVNITSTPAMADVFIDGKNFGQTPLYIPQILVGSHQLVIKHEGYNDYSIPFIINEKINTPIEALLDDKKMIDIRMECNVPDAIIYIDGEDSGKVTDLKKMALGKHKIRVVASDYNDYIANINPEEIQCFVYVVNMKPKKTKITKDNVSWENIRMTTNSSEVVGMTKLGDVTSKYNNMSAFDSIIENNRKRCIKRMKKAASKMGASVILLGTPYQGGLFNSFWVMPGTAYK